MTRRRARVRREAVAPRTIGAAVGLHNWPFLVQAAHVQQLSSPHYVGVGESKRLLAA
jgi:hypothetical protein